MELKNILDSVTSFIMDPSNDDRKPLIQGIAWVITVIVGIGTVGIVHGFSALWRKLRHIEKNETHEKIARLFEKNVLQKSIGNSPISERIPLTQPSASRDIPTITELSPLQKKARNVYQKREELWGEATKEAQGDIQKSMFIFINKIRNEFRRDKLSLSDISKDPNALNVLFQSLSLRVALVNYAKANNLNSLLNKHLVFLAQNLYDNRESFIEQAFRQVKRNLPEQLVILTIFVRSMFKHEERSIEEVFNNKEAMAIFQKSGRLMVVLSLYVKMKEASKQGPPREKSIRESENQSVKEALRLARNNAQGPGLVTRVGLKSFQSDEAQLHQGIRKFLLLNHPDKNPDVDQELVKDANQLLDLLKGGVFGVYREALEKYRKEK